MSVFDELPIEEKDGSIEARQPQVAASSTVHEAQAKILTAQDNAKQYNWHFKGKEDKRKGFSRTSPFYENATADYFFFCGFDGVSFEEAQQALKEKLTQILEEDSTLKESVNELKSS